MFSGLFDSQRPLLNWIQSPQKQSASLRQIVDRIRNSLEIDVVLQTAANEISELLKLDRCSFLWFFQDTQRLQVVCECSRTSPQSSQIGYHSLASLGELGATIASGQLVVRNGTTPPEAKAIPLIARLASRLKQARSENPIEFLGAQAYLLIPVRIEADRIGYVSCLSLLPRYWSAAEVEFMQSLGQQLEISLHHARLYEQMQKQAQREQLVNQIATQTRQSFDVSEILTQAIARLLEVLAVDRCLVHLVEDPSDRTEADATEWLREGCFRRKHLYEVCREPFPPSIEDFDTHGPITQWVIGNEQKAIISDIAQDARIGPTNEEYRKAQIKSSLVLPVQANGRLHGILYLNQCSHHRYWSENDQRLAQAVADQLAISVQQARLYEKTQQQALDSAEKARQLAQLVQREQLASQITQQTRHSLDLQTILAQTVNAMLEALSVDRCIVNLVDADLQAVLGIDRCPVLYTERDMQSWAKHRQLVSVADADGEEESAYQLQQLFEACRAPFSASIGKFDPHGPITQWVIQHCQQIAIAEVDRDPRISESKQQYQLAQIRSSLAVPVKVEGKLKAILYLDQCSHTRQWSDPDRRLAQTAADQLAISIQQAYLYAKTQQQAAENADRAKQLAETLQTLKKTQSQLIQSEKLSSLGQLVAGLAHEINNPISFIYGNLPYIKTYVTDLIHLLEAYQLHYPNPVGELQGLAEAVELDFLLRDLPRLLNSMQDGTERIRELIVALQNFSRLDRAPLQPVDIHQSLDSTLLLLDKHLQGSVQIIKQYDELPLVECYPRQIEQVFTSLLLNAVEALHRCPIEHKMIALRTQVFAKDRGDCPWVRVAIADNGLGIPLEIQPKIFDPFFTTKDIGQGMGLGLAVSYQAIVNQHQGSINFRSHPGEGTEFEIEIPICSPDTFLENKKPQSLKGLSSSMTTDTTRGTIASRQTAS